MSLGQSRSWFVYYQVAPDDLPDAVRTVAECLGALRESLRLGAASMRATSSDYLAYALIDMVVDGFFPVIKTIGDRLNDLEDEIFHNYNQQHAHYIHGSIASPSNLSTWLDDSLPVP